MIAFEFENAMYRRNNEIKNVNENCLSVPTFDYMSKIYIKTFQQRHHINNLLQVSNRGGFFMANDSHGTGQIRGATLVSQKGIVKIHTDVTPQVQCGRAH